MITNRPIEQDGKQYDRLGVSFSVMSPLPGSGSKIAVNFAFSRMNIDVNGDAEILPGEEPVYILSSDIVNTGGPAELQALGKIEAALQEYANIKGI